MRIFWLAVAILLSYCAIASASTLASEDDPKISRVPIVREKHAVPRFKLTYRYQAMPSPAGGTLHFHSGGVDVYPVSTYIRLGLGADGGYAGGELGAWYATISGALGFQYPSYATPFVEGRFSVGVLGGQVQGQTVPILLMVAGVDGGVEFYVSKRMYLSGAFGYTHPMYKAPDLVAWKAHPDQMPAMKQYKGDAWTVKLGMGF